MNGEIVVKFPLSQPKRAWKIRTVMPRRGRYLVGIETFLRNRYEIQQNDEFEWMVANGELRDILAALKEVSPMSYNEIHEAFEQVSPWASRPADFTNQHESTQDIEGLRIESRLRETQRGRRPFPYLFVLFRLGVPTESYHISDRRGQRVEEPTGRPLRSGDKLIWKPTKEILLAIVKELTALSEEHKNRARQEIFDVVNQNSTLVH